MKNFILLGLVIVAITLTRVQGQTTIVNATNIAKAKAMGSLLNATQAAATTAQQCIQNLTQFKMVMITQAKTCVGNFTNLLTTLKAQMLAAGMNFETTAMSSAMTKMNDLSTSMTGILGGVSSLISSMKTSLTNAESTILNTITSGLTSAASGSNTAMTSALSGAMSFGMNLISSFTFSGSVPGGVELEINHHPREISIQIWIQFLFQEEMIRKYEEYIDGMGQKLARMVDSEDLLVLDGMEISELSVAELRKDLQNMGKSTKEKGKNYMKD